MLISIPDDIPSLKWQAAPSGANWDAADTCCRRNAPLDGPVSAQELSPATLSVEQLSAAMPPAGTKITDAICGNLDSGQRCEIEIDREHFLINGKYQLPYSRVISSESRFADGSSGITGFRPDPVFAGRENADKTFLKEKMFKSTVLLQYKSEDGSVKTALFAFDRMKEWSWFESVARLVPYGGRPLEVARREQ